MKALVWIGPEHMAIEDVPAPTTLPNTVIIRPEAAGICGSEVEGYLGRQRNRVPPLVMGHEVAGIVSATGDGVDPTLAGRVVAVNPLLPCGHCPLCRRGLTNVCPNRTMIGIQHPGGFAELVQVPASNVIPLPAGVPATVGAMAEPFANGVHSVRLGLDMGPAEHAVIIGAGAIGLMVLAAAVVSGVPHLTVVEPFPARREHALRIGAHAAYSSSEEASVAVKASTEGFGVDLVVDAVGATATRQAAVNLVRPAGTVVALGLRDDETSIGFHHMVRNQITVRGSYAYSDADYRQALDWLVNGRAGLNDLPAPVDLAEGPRIFAELAQGPSAQFKHFLAPDH